MRCACDIYCFASVYEKSRVTLRYVY